MKRPLLTALLSSAVVITSVGSSCNVYADIARSQSSGAAQNTGSLAIAGQTYIQYNGSTIEQAQSLSESNTNYLALDAVTHLLHVMGIDASFTNGRYELNVPQFYHPKLENGVPDQVGALVINQTPVDVVQTASAADSNGILKPFMSVSSITHLLNRLGVWNQYDGTTLAVSNDVMPTYSANLFTYKGTSVQAFILRCQNNDYISIQNFTQVLNLLRIANTTSDRGVDITAPSMLDKPDLSNPADGTMPFVVSMNGTPVSGVAVTHELDVQGQAFVDYIPFSVLLNSLHRLHFQAAIAADGVTWAVQNASSGAPTPTPHNIVNPYQTYTYEQMSKDIVALAKTYPTLVRYQVMGKTAYGRNIYAIAIGTGKATVFINGSHHSREWITTNLNMYMLDQYAQAYTKHQNIGSYDVHDLLSRTTIWFIPMVNPDGVTLVQKGAGAFPTGARSRLIQMNHGSANFADWKANALGVDLNRQYSAGWSGIYWDPVKYPNYQDYKGTAPFQMNETKAVLQLVRETNPQMEIAYHASGDMVYWGYQLSGPLRSTNYAYAQSIARICGYTLYPSTNQSGGGFTDWWTHTVHRPGFTIEVSPGASVSPVPLSTFASVWRQNRTIGLYLATEGYKRYVKDPNSKVHC